jgi:transcriptional antiterminator
MSEMDVVLLLESKWVTREELHDLLGIPDRAVRSYIEDLNIKLQSYGKCILSTSSRAGYHIPSPHNEDDIAVANAVIAELESKAISIFQRRKAVTEFLKYAESAKASQRETQLTLF